MDTKKSIKYIDGIKSDAKTDLEVWERTKNNLKAQSVALSHKSKTIEIKDESDSIAERTKGWPEYDPDPNHCTGHGQRKCLEQGQHSWFNHSMDTYHAKPHLSNSPPNYWAKS